MNFCIYKISNTINDKIYIGKTSANTSRRWNDHRRVALSDNDDVRKNSIHKAISKYGIDNFTFEVIEYIEDEDVAYEKEVFYINMYNSFINGYNETKGGRGTTPTRKLTFEKIIELYNFYINENYSIKDLSNIFKLNTTSIKDIFNRKLYLDIKIPEEFLYQCWLKINRNFYPELLQKEKIGGNFRKLTELEVKEILNFYANTNLTMKEIANKYQLSAGTIDFIVRRQTWKNIFISPDDENKIKLKIDKIPKRKNKKYA